jgi:hypothetical protein
VVPDRAVSACGNQHAWVGDSGVIRAGARGEDDQVWELAAALDLERVPRAEQVRFLLLVLEKVDDEVDDRCCCVELAVECVPDGGDEVAHAGLGRGVVAQGELDARDGVGGVRRERAQAREYCCITSLEKRESTWATRRHVWRQRRNILCSDRVHRRWWG